MILQPICFSSRRKTFPGISTSDVDKRKDQHFIKWLRNQVLTKTFFSYIICISLTFSLFLQVDYDDDDADYPKWLHKVIQSPLVKVTTSQMYFTRGYTFHTYDYGRQM